MSATLIERSSFLALVAMGSDLVALHTVVRNVFPEQIDQTHGIGVLAQWGPDTDQWAWLELGWSQVEHAYSAGIAIMESDAWIHDVGIRDTQPRAADGLYGDGIVVGSSANLGHTDVANVVVEGSARVGLGNFSSSVALAQSQLLCNLIDLDAEAIAGDYFFDDQGGNQCGCGSELGACTIVSSGLEPPPPPEL